MIGATASRLSSDRGDADVAGDPAVAQQLPDDQPQPERLVFVAQPVVALEQQDLAGPGGGKARLVEDQRRVGMRIRVLQNDVRHLRVGIDLAQHHRVAVAQDHHRRQGLGQRRELSPVQPGAARAQAFELGDLEQFGDRRLARLQQMIVDELRHRELEPALPRDDDQRAKQRKTRRRLAVGLRRW